ncbi:MAG: NAD(P)-binding domain-containing protein, partial [Actinobacteria bacterium]|nr:NAD(P)-binding domain-containing protein [Actinomycetota bacterium]NIS33210.1 NAD(P)-binding domain-containing protein [Actinomycetota bacterium]NIT96727.1 NAD(P)-binding domain-containing protein [Actinomycetota bacterium]NIU20415.1 NAD(P)-binding domain-containing protein [Actinomycetota bacterium]NIU68125.1 NAD(P)-binding domain-containing protein [Actinomycetota bacterium]
AVAALAARNADVTLWARREALAEAIASTHENPDYLPGIELPATLRATSDLEEAVGGADAVVIAVPSHGFRDVVRQAAEHVRSEVP